MAEHILDNACTILAIQDLLENPNWQPRAIVEHVQHNQGMRSDAFDVITEHAPVVSHNESDVDVYEDGSMLISSEHGEYELEADEKLVVSYETDPGRGHSVCIRACEFEQYARTHTIRHLFTR